MKEEKRFKRQERVMGTKATKQPVGKVSSSRTLVSDIWEPLETSSQARAESKTQEAWASLTVKGK